MSRNDQQNEGAVSGLTGFKLSYVCAKNIYIFNASFLEIEFHLWNGIEWFWNRDIEIQKSLFYIGETTNVNILKKLFIIFLRNLLWSVMFPIFFLGWSRNIKCNAKTLCSIRNASVFFSKDVIYLWQLFHFWHFPLLKQNTEQKEQLWQVIHLPVYNNPLEMMIVQGRYDILGVCCSWEK